MNDEVVRPDRRDARFVALCLLVVLAGAFVGTRWFFRAFPEASIDFKVTRDGARLRAEAALRERGFDPKGFRALVAFDSDDDAKTFLERTLGLEKAAPLFGKTVPVWRWSVRFVKPLEKLEYRAFVAPTGELLSFRRLLPEAQAAPDPGEEAARAKAEETVRAMRGLDPAALRFVESKSEKRPARVDRTFVWESRSVRFGDAGLRYLVEVQGDRVGRSSIYLEVPQQWKREYATLRSKNIAANSVAGVLLVLTLAAIVVVWVQRLMRHDVPWKTAIAFGGVGVLLQLLSGLNALPNQLFDYPTTESWSSFLFRSVAGTVGLALLLGVVVALLVAGGEPLYRERYPSLPALGRIFSRRALGTRRFFRGLLLGYALTAAFFAYQVVFYVVAERFGAWAPADVPYSSLLGTAFPWLGVLVMGFYPAATEEFSSRMFSIPFLSRFVPVPVAVVLPAVIWGFAHSAYPNQPFWIRPLELTVVGTVIGWVMLKEGLLPLLVWHFTVDALYTALVLLRSSNGYFVVSGALSAFVLLLPLLVSAALAARRGGFLPDEELTNAAVGSAPAPERRAASLPLTFAPPGRVARPLVLALGAAAALLLLASLLLPRERLQARPSLGRGAAAAAADRELRAHGDDPKAYLRMPVTGSALPDYDAGSEDELLPYGWSDEASLWLLGRGGPGLLRKFAGSVLPGAVWQVRYVRSADPHGAWVAVDASSGRLVGIRRSVPDEEAGARLDDAAARARADALLRDLGVDPAAFTLVAREARERKARRDHRFLYESRGDAGAGVPQRVVVKLAGDAPALLAGALKLPEKWLRERDRLRPVTHAGVTLKVVGLATLAALAIVELVRAARRGAVPWLALLRPAAVLTLPTLLLEVVSLPLVLRAYPPEFPLGTFAVVAGMGDLLGLCIAFALAYVALAFVVAARPDALAAFRRGTPGGGRAVLLGAGAALCVTAGGLYRGVLFAAFPAALGAHGLSFPPGVDTLLPAAALLSSTVQSLLLVGGGAGLAALLLRDFLRPVPMRAAAFVLLAGAVAPAGPRSAPELLVPWLSGLLAAAALLAAMAVLLRDEPRAYVAALVVLAALRGGAELAGSAVPAWRANGIVALVVSTAFLVVLWRRGRLVVP